MQKIERILDLFAGIFAIGIIWQLLELAFYGEIQPRIVDEFITLAWAYFVVKAYQQGMTDERKKWLP